MSTIYCVQIVVHSIENISSERSFYDDVVIKNIGVKFEDQKIYFSKERFLLQTGSTINFPIGKVCFCPAEQLGFNVFVTLSKSADVLSARMSFITFEEKKTHSIFRGVITVPSPHRKGPCLAINLSVVRHQLPSLLPPPETVSITTQTPIVQKIDTSVQAKPATTSVKIQTTKVSTKTAATTSAATQDAECQTEDLYDEGDQKKALFQLIVVIVARLAAKWAAASQTDVFGRNKCMTRTAQAPPPPPHITTIPVDPHAARQFTNMRKLEIEQMRERLARLTEERKKSLAESSGKLGIQNERLKSMKNNSTKLESRIEANVVPSIQTKSPENSPLFETLQQTDDEQAEQFSEAEKHGKLSPIVEIRNAESLLSPMSSQHSSASELEEIPEDIVPTSLSARRKSYTLHDQPRPPLALSKSSFLLPSDALSARSISDEPSLFTQKTLLEQKLNSPNTSFSFSNDKTILSTSQRSTSSVKSNSKSKTGSKTNSSSASGTSSKSSKSSSEASESSESTSSASTEDSSKSSDSKKSKTSSSSSTLGGGSAATIESVEEEIPTVQEDSSVASIKSSAVSSVLYNPPVDSKKRDNTTPATQEYYHLPKIRQQSVHTDSVSSYSPSEM